MAIKAPVGVGKLKERDIKDTEQEERGEEEAIKRWRELVERWGGMAWDYNHVTS